MTRHLPLPRPGFGEANWLEFTKRNSAYRATTAPERSEGSGSLVPGKDLSERSEATAVALTKDGKPSATG